MLKFQNTASDKSGKLYQWFKVNLDSDWFGWISRSLAILSVVLYVVETDVIHSANSRVGPPSFLWTERFVAVLFTVEYLLRLWVSDNRRHYITRNRGIIDLLAILPFWLGFIVPHRFLHIIRALRVLRLFKFYRYNSTMQALFNEFRKHSRRICTILYVFASYLFVMSAVMYEIEGPAQPDKFGTIMGSMWYSFVTAATIGYGDLAPLSTWGKTASVLLSIGGLAMFATILAVVSDIYSTAFKADPEPK